MFFSQHYKLFAVVVGIERILIDQGGNVAYDFTWGWGNTTNNEEEALTVSQGLEMLQECNIKQTTMFSDSSMIIQFFLNLSTPLNASLSQWN